MRIKSYIFIPAIAIILIIIALAVLLMTMRFDTTLEFSVIDAVSKNWVWEMNASIQDRYIAGYYQSDTGPVRFRFTGLKPGNDLLKLDAPYYTPLEIPVTVKSGKNEIREPIEMMGYEIPGLVEMFVFKEQTDAELILNPRPIDANGEGIGTHPCLDMWFGLRISVQVRNGIIAQQPAEKGSDRGEELFRGRCDWEWDAYPDAYYRYIIKLPKEKIRKSNAPLNVYDYIIVFPDPRKIENDEFKNKMERLLTIAGPVELKIYLDSFGDKIKYFISSDWNQAGT